ncbi:MAG TPA: hypothetical protein VFW94_15000 [Candidatus Acidoferrales bacterium]|nr:hypothetical protein [Candidatus Acidoferrales bacterium]
MPVESAKFAGAYKEEEVLRETKENNDSPIVPSEEPSDPNPQEPTSNLDISVDTICDVVHNSWHTVFGTKSSLAKSDIETLEQLGRDGRWATTDDLARDLSEYRDKGGKATVAKFLVFVQGGEMAVARKNKTYASKRQTYLGSNAGRREVSQHPPIQPATPKREIPPQAYEWNAEIPDRAWVAWDSKLNALMHERLSDQDFVAHWPMILVKCKEIFAKQHSKNGYVTFPWVLKEGNWSSLLNGVHDFLLASEASAHPKRKSFDERNHDVIQEAKAMREKGRNGTNGR